MRISREDMFMSMAEVAARRSTCSRGNVGAIVVRNNDAVSIGYNGPRSGEIHCTGTSCELSPTGGCLRSVHAECNAIERAMDKVEVSLGGCDLYCTYSPCLECAKKIVNNYVSRFFYRYSYRDPNGLDYLKLTEEMKIYRVTPSGFIIDARTGELCEL